MSDNTSDNSDSSSLPEHVAEVYGNAAQTGMLRPGDVQKVQEYDRAQQLREKPKD